MKTTPIQIVVGLLQTLACVQAQTFTTIKSFSIASNITGLNPNSTLVQGPDGALYGTTSGGDSAGTVFKIQPDGSGFTVLKRFGSAPYDGAEQLAGLTLSGGENRHIPE